MVSTIYTVRGEGGGGGEGEGRGGRISLKCNLAC